MDTERLRFEMDADDFEAVFGADENERELGDR